MKKIYFSLLAFIAMILASSVARAQVLYEFNFINLHGQTNSTTVADFKLKFVFQDYVNSLGLAPLDGAPYKTSLGMPVSYAGANDSNWWGFDDDNLAVLADNGFTANGNAFLVRFFDQPSGYLNKPGEYKGIVIGNAPAFVTAFEGAVTLTISAVPEPSTIFMAALGLIFLLAQKNARQYFFRYSQKV